MRSISTVEIPHNVNIYNTPPATASTLQYSQNKYFNNHYNQEIFNKDFHNERDNSFLFVSSNLKNNQIQHQNQNIHQQQLTLTKGENPLKKSFSFIFNNNSDYDNVKNKTEYYEQKSFITFNSKKYNTNNNAARRSKSTIVAPTLATSAHFQNNSIKSLHRFNSRLRKVSCALFSNVFPELLCNNLI